MSNEVLFPFILEISTNLGNNNHVYKGVVNTEKLANDLRALSWDGNRFVNMKITFGNFVITGTLNANTLSVGKKDREPK